MKRKKLVLLLGALPLCALLICTLLVMSRVASPAHAASHPHTTPCTQFIDGCGTYNQGWFDGCNSVLQQDPPQSPPHDIANEPDGYRGFVAGYNYAYKNRPIQCILPS